MCPLPDTPFFQSIPAFARELLIPLYILPAVLFGTWLLIRRRRIGIWILAAETVLMIVATVKDGTRLWTGTANPESTLLALVLVSAAPLWLSGPVFIALSALHKPPVAGVLAFFLAPPVSLMAVLAFVVLTGQIWGI